jgi:chemotaxis protein CheY-P-specific phosphatase CheC
MIKTLSESEFQVASKLIFEGLSMAKSSMEQILQSPITIEKIDYEDHKPGIHRFVEEEEGNVHLIKTELMGELKGISHLIFSEKEVSKLYAACLPPSVLNDDSKESEIMKMGFLTEIDNMVAAAVITEFSNFLNLEIYGQVPSLAVIPSKGVNEYLETESRDFDSIVHFKAIFHGKELDISPDFVWVFNSKFVDRIKNLI